jgi:hypothetical protein
MYLSRLGVDAADPPGILHMAVCDRSSVTYRAACRKATTFKNFDTALHNALASVVDV